MILQKQILFYKAIGKFGFLSNLFKREIEFESRKFPTSEHAYQYGKFKDEAVREWAMQAPKPHLLALLAHNLLFYDMVSNWNSIKVDRMRAVLFCKFTQHPDLAQKLLETTDCILIEDSESDGFWGIGKNKKGQNMLGQLLMEVRSKLSEH